MITARDEPSLLRECHENFVETFGGIARTTRGGVVERCGSLTIVRTGIRSASFNPVFALDPPGEVARVAQRIGQLLLGGGLPWALVTTSSTDAALAPLIEELGLERAMILPGMVRDIDPSSLPPPSTDLEVHPVTTGEERRDFAAIVTGAFGAPPGLLAPWIGAIVGPSRRVSFYLGYTAGRPVCASLRVVTGRIAGIYLVSTLPEFRRRGFGAVMTWRAARDGYGEGCTVGYLQASGPGRSVYEQMGYRVVEEYHIWFQKSGSRTSPRARLRASGN